MRCTVKNTVFYPEIFFIAVAFCSCLCRIFISCYRIINDRPERPGVSGFRLSFMADRLSLDKIADMNRKRIYFLQALLLLSFTCLAGNDSLAIRSYTMNGGNREFGYLGIPLANGRSALFNITANCNTAQCQHGMAGIIIDANGKVVFRKKIGSAVTDVDPNLAIYTSDKHIVMLGGYETDKRMLIRMDTTFNIEWTRIIELKENGSFYGPSGDGLVELNGNYYVLFANEFTKITPSGSVVFSKYYGPAQNNTDPAHNRINFCSLTLLDQGRFFVGGEIVDAGGYNELAFLSIIDTNGNILKQKKATLTSTYNGGITHSFKVSANLIKVFGHLDNNLYMADVDTNMVMSNAIKMTGTILYTHSVCYNGTDRYYISAYEHNTAKISVLGVDNAGTVLWSKFIKNGSGYFRSYNYMIDDCAFAVYGSGTQNTAIRNYGLWTKMNRNGETASPLMEAPLTITTSAMTPVMSATTAVDSGQWQTTFLSETFLYDNTQVSDSLWFETENSVVCASTPPVNSVQEMEMQKGLLCNENPVYGSIAIASAWELRRIKQLLICDIHGRVVYAAKQPSDRTIDISGVPAGMLLVRWMYDDKVYVQRLLAE